MNKSEPKPPTYRAIFALAVDHLEEIALIELSRMIRETQQKENRNA